MKVEAIRQAGSSFEAEILCWLLKARDLEIQEMVMH